MEKEIQQVKTVLGLKHKRKRSFRGMQALALMTLAANLELVWFRDVIGHRKARFSDQPAGF